MWQEVIPVMLTVPAASLCVKPYPLHKRGCPNIGKKDGCPPRCKKLNEEFDLWKPVYAIYTTFDIKSHMEKMKSLHPEWSERQLRCVLYWQPKARKALVKEIGKFLEEHQRLKVVRCPEANGVNISETLKNAPSPVVLEWPPMNVAYQVALAGSPK